MKFKVLRLYSILAFMAIAATSNSQTKISFTVSFIEPQAHYADIEMLIEGINKDYIDIKMPVWAPGSYLIREFPKNVEGLYARNNKGERISSSKINKNTWRIASAKSNMVKVNYRVYAFEVSVRTSFVDASHAFLSPPAAFMYVDGLINNPATVIIKPAENWKKISTGLDPVKDKPNSFYASDFDVLFDSPIEIGNQDIFEFTAAGVHHEVAMYGGGNYDKEKLKQDMAVIVEDQTAIFGENPNKRYVFIVHNFHSGGGGLEHLNSTVLGASRNSYTNETSYKGFLGLVAHEYFHLWNVKRLRPVALGPFNYDAENYTTNLWVAEGFTAYYDNLTLCRSGFYSQDRYLQVLAQDISTVENQPGNKIQSVAEASFDAWIKYYRPNENSKNSSISYYDKGSLMGLIFDLEIIHATKGKKGLDDVLKAMYDEYYKKQKRGYTDAEFRAMVEKVAGRSFEKIYRDYINGTAQIKFNDHLGHAGLYLTNDNEGNNSPYLGITSSLREGKISVSSVMRGSPAWKDGLNVNDEILAVNNTRISGLTELDKFLSSKRIGDQVNFLITRDGVPQTIKVTLEPNPNTSYRIVVDETPTAEQLAVRKKWLHLK